MMVVDASAILAILHSPDLAEGLVTRGRAMIAERFTLDRMVRSYETLYEDLLRTKVGVRQQYAPRLGPSRSAEPRVAHLSIHGH